MSDAFKTYPGLAPLSERKMFEGVVLGDGGGGAVEWPTLDIQIGADTLLLDALAQNAPDENTRVFIRWRLRHRMTLDQAAEALGVSARSISRLRGDASKLVNWGRLRPFASQLAPTVAYVSHTRGRKQKRPTFR